MTPLPMIDESWHPSLKMPTPEQMRIKDQRRQAAKFRNELKREEMAKFNKLLFHRGQIAGARMKAHGLDDSPYRFMAMTIFAYSPLESWFGQPDERERLARALKFCQACAAADDNTESAYPTVRVVYDETTLIGPLSDCLNASKNKTWGTLVAIETVRTGDTIYTNHVGIIYHENNRYNRRFLQRKRLRKMLPANNRKSVLQAFRSTKAKWLADITQEQTEAIRRAFNTGPAEFWQACKGTRFLELPPELRQGDLFADCEE